MREFRFAALVIAATALAAAQSTPNSVTITASRQISFSPSSSQLVITINVTSPLSAGLDDVVSAVSGLGVTATNLTGISGTSPVPGSPSSNAYLQWSFTQQVEVSKVAALVSTLTKIQQTLAQGNNGWALGYSVGNTNSPAPDCPLSDLLSDARNKAKDVASGSGFTVGNILALSNAPLAVPGAAIPAARLTAVLSPAILVVSSEVCSIAVKFELLQ